MKRIFALVMSIVSMFVMASCGLDYNHGDPNEEVDINVDKNITATLRVGIRNEVAEEAMMNSVAAGFIEQYPNVTINIERIADYEQTIMGNVVAGEMYDILWAADQNVTFLAENDIIFNLDKLIEKSGFDTSKYYESLINLGKKNHKESQYMLPRDYSKIVTYINKSFFEEASIAIPSPEWTWQDFNKIAAQLKTTIENSTSKKRLVLDARFDWLIMAHGFTSSFGGKMLDANGSGVFDENYKKGLEEIRNTVYVNKYAKSPLQYSSTGEVFFAGNSAMFFETRAKFSSAASTVGDKLVVVPMPAIGNSPKVGTGTTGYSIATGSKVKNVAWKFLEYMMSESGQEKMSETGDVVPSLKSLADKPDAKWKQVALAPNIDHSAFILYPERDVIQDYFDAVPAKLVDRYRTTVEDMLRGITDQGKRVSVATQLCSQEIADILASL